MRIASVGFATFLLSVASVCAAEPPFWPCTANDGMPFGQLRNGDDSELLHLATANGVDLESMLKGAYTGDKAALAKVYQFSLKLNSRDMAMRVYGQMVYSMFLNIAEQRGPDFLISVLIEQSSAVRQRVRDFLWYPTFCVLESERAAGQDDIRKDFPRLFPPDYVFGKDDNLFTKTPNSAVNAPHSAVTARANCGTRRAVRRARYRER